MNYPQNAEELLKWDTSTGRDSFGFFIIITGFEGTSSCFWCGRELEGRRRYCGHRSGHWTRYQEYFGWPSARNWCIERYDYTCANCGYREIAPDGHHPSWYTEGFEVHHIIPLKGEDRAISVFNVPWNLICLCHNCHQLVHATLKPPKTAWAKNYDNWEYAKSIGQEVMDLAQINRSSR